MSASPPPPPAPRNDADEPSTVGASAELDEHLTRDFGFDSDEWAHRAQRASRASEPLGFLGKYELVLELGRGAQGVVYKAIQPGTGRIVALKRLGAGMLPQDRDRERLRQEVMALTRLNHPNVVTVYSTEVLDGHPVLVMEYVEGTPIDRWADARHTAENKAGVRAVLECYLGVCDGVEHAHQRGVIHRDIKPSNVLVSREGHAKVLDFGIARLTDKLKDAAARPTVTGFAGTPAYAAPEQILGSSDRIDTRCDVYALGALLRRIVTGADLFAPDASLAHIVDSARSGTRIPASRMRPGLPRDLDWVVLRAMAAEPDQRYPSVGALAEDVRRVLDGRAIEARQPTLRYTTGRFVARHKVACILGAAAIIAVVVLSAVSTLQAVRLGAKGEQLENALKAERTSSAAAIAARISAEAQERVANDERDRQRATAEYLLNLADGVAENSRGRATVPIDELARWFEGSTGSLGAFDEVADPIMRARLHLGLAVMHSVSGNGAQAVEHNRQALALLPGPGHERLRLHALIRMCAHQGSKVSSGETAIAYMKEAGLEKDPIAVDAWRQYATALSRGRRADDALAALREATAAAELTSQPVEVKALIASDECAVLYRARRLDEGWAAGERAIAMVPEADRPESEACRRASVTLGEIAYRRADAVTAESHFANAARWSLAAQGDSHIATRNAMRWHARALQEVGRYDDAATRYERLLQLVPPANELGDIGTWWVRFRYGATLLGQGREQEAERQLRLAIGRGRPENMDAKVLDAHVAAARAALNASGLKFTPELKKSLGELEWLVDFTAGAAMEPPSEVPQPPPGSVPDTNMSSDLP